MTSENFTYWLHGFFELSEVTKLDEKQTDLIRRHLTLVYTLDDNPSIGFVKWLKGIFDESSPKEFDVAEVKAIKRLLSESFNTVIDPTLKFDKQVGIFEKMVIKDGRSGLSLTTGRSGTC